MPHRPEDAIDFGCPRCQARLWAGPCQAGQRLRCPFCQVVLPVPTAEQAAARAGKSGPEAEYTLHEGPAPSCPQPKYLAVTCPVCAARMVAAPDQVGQTLACPDCDTAVEVRAPVEPAAPKRPAAPADEYPLWGVGQPPPDVKAVYQTYIPVVCSVCRTRMLATEAEVGRALTCPDCRTATVVRPLPPATPQRTPVPANDAEASYGVRAGAGEPGPGSADYATHFPVICPVCNTRLHAGPDQVGRELICPDCRTPILVRAPAAAVPKLDPMEGADAGYTVAAPIELPQWQPVFESSGPEAEREAKDVKQPAERLPRRDAVRPSGAAPGDWWRGIAGFPLKRSVWPRWVLSSMGMMGVLLLSALATWVSTAVSPGAGFGGIGIWILGMILSGLAGMAAILWLVVFGASAVVIVVETAAGADAIEGWPDGPYQDWMPDAFYMVNALAVGAIPGAALGWLPAASELPGGVWLAASLFVMFPIVLLSMLEWGSAIRPLSLAILASLLWTWWAWALFYVAAAVLLASSVTLAALAVWALGGAGSAPAVCILVGALLIYFRMLGRLGMVCGGSSRGA